MPGDSAALRRLRDRVLAARDSNTPLDICGGDSKRFYGNQPRGERLDTAELAGITNYEPTELCLTALAATPLALIEAELAQHGQCLAFEPPRFGSRGTVGGMVAAGLSGPARAAVGPVRDYLLGVTVLNGVGELLSFGGQVMKNVAGYDVSRVFAGSLGILGVVCEVSLKVMPTLPASRTFALDLDAAAAILQLNDWAARGVPVTASAWYRGCLTVRLGGARARIERVHEFIGGRELEPEDAARWWSELRDHRHSFLALDEAALARGETLWRLSVPDTTSDLKLPGEQLIEWGGAQRWYRGSAAPLEVRAVATAVGGHATLVRGRDKSCSAFAPLARPTLELHRRLKQSFDPGGIFNPGRLHPDL